MAHTLEKKQHVINTLYEKADGNASKCAHLTGVDRKTIQKWKQEHEQNQPADTDLPTVEEIKQRIVRRVYTIIQTCRDPKKLMDTLEAINRYQQQNGQTKTSLFETIENKLTQ